MRTIALLATYNEERFITACLGHLTGHGLEVYLIDNESTDGTVELAERFRGRGLVGIETLPREGVFSLRKQLARKEELAATLDADWFVHVDADEVRLPPGTKTLAEALAEADRAGYSAVNFQELTFVPTREAPDHDHPDYEQTLRSYYAYLPTFPHRLNAWKRPAVGRTELGWSGGHQVRFPGLRMFPRSFPMRHYLFLSVPHLVRKYADKTFDPAEVGEGWHGWRPGLKVESVELPSARLLRHYRSDDELDASRPYLEHLPFRSAG
jgi:Glycosyl transferase family 2